MSTSQVYTALKLVKNNSHASASLTPCSMRQTRLTHPVTRFTLPGNRRNFVSLRFFLAVSIHTEHDADFSQSDSLPAHTELHKATRKSSGKIVRFFGSFKTGSMQINEHDPSLHKLSCGNIAEPQPWRSPAGFTPSASHSRSLTGRCVASNDTDLHKQLASSVDPAVSQFIRTSKTNAQKRQSAGSMNISELKSSAQRQNPRLFE